MQIFFQKLSKSEAPIYIKERRAPNFNVYISPVQSRFDQTTNFQVRNLKQRTHRSRPEPMNYSSNEIYAIPKIEAFPIHDQILGYARLDYGSRIASGFVEAESARKNATRSLFVAEEFSPRWKVKACGLRLRKVFLPFSLFFAFYASLVFFQWSLSLSREICREKLIEWKRGKDEDSECKRLLIVDWFFFLFRFTEDSWLRGFIVIG